MREPPHIAGVGRSDAQTAGLSGLPNNAQRSSGSSCTQRTPAGLPSGMPGIGLEIEGAVQQAPHRSRQFMARHSAIVPRMLRIALAGLHLLALAIGLMAVVLRGSLLKGTVTSETLRRAFRMDTFWGVAAALWLVTGLWRLLGHTEKATAYYWSNHLFLTKMVLFVAVFALEMLPLLTMLRWRRRLQAGEPPAAFVAPAEARRVALFGHIEATLLLVMIFLAVAMARGYGVPPG